MQGLLRRTEFKSQLSRYPCECGQGRGALLTSGTCLLSEDHSCCLVFNAYHVPGSVLSTLKIISYNHHNYLYHHTDEETKAQSCTHYCPRSQNVQPMSEVV